MSNSKKIVSTKTEKNSHCLIHFLLFLIVITSFPPSAFADGFVFVRHISERWELGEETEQKAIINYEDGIQKMILRIGLSKEQRRDAVWIFPIPADPENISIDVTAKLPEFRGRDIVTSAESNIRGVTEGLLFTQILPIVPMSLVMSASLGGVGASFGGDSLSGVTVHNQVVKEGITTEVITAKTGSSIYNYLNSLGLDANEDMVPVLDQYIGKKASFIVSWISGDTSKSDSKGVCVSFPTKEIYFPLIPTSIYGNKVVPATIYVSGLVNPKIYNAISSNTEINYLTMLYHKGPDPIGFCQEGKSFTKIHIKAPSDSFSEDLWISRKTPIRITCAMIISKHPLVMFFFSLFFFSALAGVITGVVVFAEARESLKGIRKFALIGLSNCLTIIGLIICIILTTVKKIPQEDMSKVVELTSRGYKVFQRDNRKSIFIVLYIIIFCTIVPLSFYGLYSFVSP